MIGCFYPTKMKKYKWTEEELRLLEKLADKYPSFSCYQQYQKQAKKLGYPYRSIWSIRRRVAIEFNGFRNIVRLNNLTIKDLSEILGLHKSTIQNWINEGKLRATRKENKISVITINNIKEFARNYPSRLAAVSKDRLLYLFENDINLIQSILTFKPSTRGKGKKKRVKDLRTGRVYESLKQAAHELHYSGGYMSKLIQKGNGFIFLPD